MNSNEVINILKAFSESCVCNMTYKNNESLLVLSKDAKETQQIVTPQSLTPLQATIETPPAIPAKQASPDLKSAITEKNYHIIKSPIIGTYYSSPSPDAPAFIKVGDRVSKGDELCIIEAMKVMNIIECDISGKVSRILIDNEKQVEFGTPLVEIIPEGKE